MPEAVWLTPLLPLTLGLWLRWMLLSRCPRCGRRSAAVVDDLWDRQWTLCCRRCGHTWGERC